MNELLKDLRHVIRHFVPGTVCLLLFCFSLWYAKDFSFWQNFQLNPPIKIIIPAFFVLAAILGFLFATLYFGIRYIFGFLSIDTCELVNSLRNAGHLYILDHNTGFVNTDNVSQEIDAWAITSTLYYTRSNDSDIFGRLEMYRTWNATIQDYFHSSGATIVGIPISGIIWIIVHSNTGSWRSIETLRYINIGALWLGVWAVFLVHFFSTKATIKRLATILYNQQFRGLTNISFGALIYYPTYHSLWLQRAGYIVFVLIIMIILGIIRLNIIW
jgi:hypothetical protein